LLKGSEYHGDEDLGMMIPLLVSSSLWTVPGSYWLVFCSSMACIARGRASSVRLDPSDAFSVSPKDCNVVISKVGLFVAVSVGNTITSDFRSTDSGCDVCLSGSSLKTFCCVVTGPDSSVTSVMSGLWVVWRSASKKAAGWLVDNMSGTLVLDSIF